jgi:hypothetical protein
MAAQTIGLQLGNQMGRLWRSYERVLKKRPVLTQATTSAALWSVGDLIAQRLETIGKEKKVRGQEGWCCCCCCSAADAEYTAAVSGAGARAAAAGAVLLVLGLSPSCCCRCSWTAAQHTCITGPSCALTLLSTSDPMISQAHALTRRMQSLHTSHLTHAPLPLTPPHPPPNLRSRWTWCAPCRLEALVPGWWALWATSGTWGWTRWRRRGSHPAAGASLRPRWVGLGWY